MGGLIPVTLPVATPPRPQPMRPGSPLDLAGPDGSRAPMNSGSGFTTPRFGTDGIRGPAGTPPMDRETMRRLGAALGLWLQ